jgi:adenine-specific DNA-methyltransferase
MANLSKIRRDRLISYIEKLKQEHTDDESIILFNELENALTEKRYGLIFEEHTEEVDDLLRENVPVFTVDPERRICSDPEKSWNFILEGDNLQALYLLEKTHKGKVDCIYIDPPYNTGATDWKYNNDYVGREDDYRHSKWLSMMKSRLLIAKKLLNPQTGVLICTIDEKEYLHLGCLLEELFPEAYMQMVTIVINPKGSTRGRFSRVEEYAFFCFMPDAYVSGGTDPMLGEIQESNEGGQPRWKGLLRSGMGSRREDSPNLYYPILIDAKNNRIIRAEKTLPLGEHADITAKIDGCEAAWPVRSDYTEGRWMLSSDTFNEMLAKGYIQLGKYDEKRKTWGFTYLSKKYQEQIESGELKIVGHTDNGQSVVVEFTTAQERQIRTVWHRTRHDAGAYGSDLVSSVIGRTRAFSYPKSLYAVIDCLSAIVKNKPNALILDFFAGSGTTLHAVHLLNEMYGGNRRCILVTNNEIASEEESRLKKLGYKKGDEEWEKLGIAKFVTWPRTVCSITGKKENGVPHDSDYLVNDSEGNPIPMSRGFVSNVKYFKCDWVSRETDSYLSEALMEHVKEMIELEHAIEVDGVKTCIVLSEEEADELEASWDSHSALTRIYISRNVLLTTKQNDLFNTVEMHMIPDYYFDIELKEVGETW